MPLSKHIYYVQRPFVTLQEFYVLMIIIVYKKYGGAGVRRRFFFFFLLFMFLVPQVTLAGSLNPNVPSGNAPVLPALQENSMPPIEDVLPKVELANVRWLVNKENNNLRLVIDTTGPVTVNNTLDGTKSQVIIDIPGAITGKITDSVALDGEIADQVSFATIANNNSRVVISLCEVIDDSNYTVFTLPSDSTANKMFRVVVDINKLLPKTEYNFTPGLQNKVIVIDPGHGGSDSGAVGPNKTQEKTITLAVAQKVQALLEKAGAEVLMTRQTDKDVYAPNDSAVDELRARTLVANDNKADVFLSIHIDAFTTPTTGGTTTYYYPKSKYDVILAKSIQSNLIAAGKLQNRGRRPARFHVLRNTEMPAILAELAFISNPNEEKIINSLQFQQEMAQAIVQGLDDFFALAAKKGGAL